ncbi:hypothetical protein ANOM_005053 [Aspergillus nomiae NRRL 13137]|uniref:Uncharacterized protein n=1 Tax=Aspergillus nomiae NRRL (strain ATCC 15546 / NRRL 13137 / CBS 260.88 / M93) TaxID=1509407 RepID=A0A0L1J484_ASPN3|nr:uncharacterized protein ANOM_005053 [Aspergillus nomiae NRRL 13137]KNG86470.1 hypothetical protein ANOM_005053 [Aspergillus nomiae NRRL 13137]
MFDIMSPQISFTKKRRWSPRMEDQYKLANAKKNLSSLHTFTFNFLKNKTSPRTKYRDSQVEIPHSDEERIACMLANATHTELDLHKQSDSDGDQGRPLSSLSSNTSSRRSIHGSPPVTPLLVHSELNLTTTEPFPDYYESCEQNPAIIDKDLEEAYNNAIAKVFEESVRMRNLGAGNPATVSPLATHVGCPVTTDSHPRQAKPSILLTSHSTLHSDTTSRSQSDTAPTPISQISSATSVRADSDKGASMTSTSQAWISLDDTGAHKVSNATPANDVSVRDVASGSAPISTIAPQFMADRKANIQARHVPSSSSSAASNDSSEGALSQLSPVVSVSHLVSGTSDTRTRDDQNNQYYAPSFHSSQHTLSGAIGSHNVGQASFSSIQGSMSLSGSTCSSQTCKRTLSIDEMAMPDEPPTPNFQPPIGTGRPLPGTTPMPARNPHMQRRLHEAEERKLNILEEMRIILRADHMKDDIQRRFTAMTNIILRMEWILFRRDVKPDGTHAKEFLSAPVVEEVQALAIPMVQYLAWLDKKLESELSISQQVLHWIIQIAKNQDLDVYQRFRQTARVIIGNLRKPRLLEKHLLTVFQDLYDTYVYSDFLNIRNRQILREEGLHIERDNLARLLIAGWDVLSRAIENYNEIITINLDLKSRFVDPIMDRLPRSYEIWEEEWKEHQRQCEILRNMELEKLWTEVEERACAEAEEQEFARAQARAMAEFRAQMQFPGQGQSSGQWHVDSRIQV